MKTLSDRYRAVFFLYLYTREKFLRDRNINQQIQKSNFFKEYNRKNFFI